jgi:hypothetical protein
MPATKKKPAGKAQRTTHRSKSGTKLYAVRDSKGRFKDIQTYKRAHAADMRKKSKTEKPAAAKRTRKVTPAPTPAEPEMESPMESSTEPMGEAAAP